MIFELYIGDDILCTFATALIWSAIFKANLFCHLWQNKRPQLFNEAFSEKLIPHLFIVVLKNVPEDSFAVFTGLLEKSIINILFEASLPWMADN